MLGANTQSSESVAATAWQILVDVALLWPVRTACIQQSAVPVCVTAATLTF
jgi:hypothetical protein